MDDLNLARRFVWQVGTARACVTVKDLLFNKVAASNQHAISGFASQHFVAVQVLSLDVENKKQSLYIKERKGQWRLFAHGDKG